MLNKNHLTTNKNKILSNEVVIGAVIILVIAFLTMSPATDSFEITELNELGFGLSLIFELAIIIYISEMENEENEDVDANTNENPIHS